MKDKKLTVTGDIDPVTVVRKLRKLCGTEILSVGAAKEEKKKEKPKKEEAKKEEPKKKEEKKDEKKEEKAVLNVYLYDVKTMRDAMKIVSDISGLESVSVDMKDKKMTVTVGMDPVTILKELRKLCGTEILSGPKEPKKEEEGKKKKKKEAEEERKKKRNKEGLPSL